MSRKKSNSLYKTVVFIVCVFVFFYALYEEMHTTIPVETTPTINQLTPWVSNSGHPHIQAYFTRHDNGPFSQSIGQHLVDLINQSQQSIDAAVYEFDIPEVSQALVEAFQRGVRVRVVYDPNACEEDGKLNDQIKQLKKAKIPLTAYTGSAIMHNKFFVFDQQTVWTGSFNISVKANTKNDENVMVITASDFAENYSTEFEELFAGEFGAQSPQNTPHPTVWVDGIRVDTFFAPEDEVMSAVVVEAENATSSINFMAFSFTDDQLAEVFGNKQSNNIPVAGVYETSQASNTYSTDEWLQTRHAQIMLDCNAGTMHNKVIIIDHQTTITGSFNFSKNADTNNDENLIIIHSPEIAQQYLDTFNAVKEYNRDSISGMCQ
jgi:phosphatidylserine/phosphatidylglycerophosphate/cardiolipin synthase-like enzyme